MMGFLSSGLRGEAVNAIAPFALGLNEVLAAHLLEDDGQFV